MRAVNLVPQDARRGSASTGAGSRFGLGAFGPAQVVIGVLVIVVALTLLRVLADNGVNDRQATLVAVQSQVATEQTQASQLSVYSSFVQAAQQREQQVREIAEQRFPWQRTLDQLSRVIPATTSLTSLSASTAAPATTTTVAAAGGPTFTLSGCAATPNQNGIATLLRRLRALSGVAGVGFQSSTRSGDCNNFGLTLSFSAPGASATSTTGATRG